MVKSAYIHIPFCRSKCYYCSFVSYTNENLKSKYIDALYKEITQVYKNELLQTLYIGGGTPSLLDSCEFHKIIDLFTTDDKTEITTELNPEGYSKNGLDKDYLHNLKNYGVNRISIGAQTFNDNILKLINRRHDSKQTIFSVKNSQKIGINNINLDFIYGLPEQNLDSFIKDLEIAISLGIKHISLYGLSIEKGCYFYKNSPKNIANDDLQTDMYLAAVEFLCKNGFIHYEFSNFSLPGYESQHNLNYWKNKKYYGFGTAAHGYMDKIRYSHSVSIEKYIHNPTCFKIESTETETSQLEETIFLGFRIMTGIDIDEINQKFGIDFEKKYGKIIAKYLPQGYMKVTDKGYALTPKGVLVSNRILSEFIE